MELIIEERDGVRIVTIEGELDTFGAQQFREALAYVRPSERYLVTLENVSFVDSAGLHALFGAARSAKEVGASIAFVVPGESPVRKVVELVQLADVSPVCESTAEAADRLNADIETLGFADPDTG